MVSLRWRYACSHGRRRDTCWTSSEIQIEAHEYGQDSRTDFRYHAYLYLSRRGYCGFAQYGRTRCQKLPLRRAFAWGNGQTIEIEELIDVGNYMQDDRDSI